jgi:hypothetical protein
MRGNDTCHKHLQKEVQFPKAGCRIDIHVDEGLVMKCHLAHKIQPKQNNFTQAQTGSLLGLRAEHI